MGADNTPGPPAVDQTGAAAYTAANGPELIGLAGEETVTMRGGRPPRLGGPLRRRRPPEEGEDAGRPRLSEARGPAAPRLDTRQRPPPRGMVGEQIV